jgi:hypothetical protein
MCQGTARGLARNWLPRRARALSEQSGRFAYDRYTNHCRTGIRAGNHTHRGVRVSPSPAGNANSSVPSEQLDAPGRAGLPHRPECPENLSRESHSGRLRELSSSGALPMRLRGFPGRRRPRTTSLGCPRLKRRCHDSVRCRLFLERPIAHPGSFNPGSSA